ncbi:MAG TPA: cytidylate kinase-like family protein [Thermodesulfovibrionales bacterium]|nr:cytidylate kinase-like family protein [Thermodesulfovibrionales bacterium]
MSVITISRGSFSRGKEIAEKVAHALGYECISREILLEASQQFNLPELKLVRAIHDAPSVLERFTYGKEKYIAVMRAALLKHIQKDNIVYHGLAGQFLLQQIPHVLKVRIIADIEDRVREEMKRENISAEDARYILKKDDEERRKWGLQLYGKDTSDPSLYDIVLHLRTMSVDEAAQLVVAASKLPSYHTTPRSQGIVDDLCLAAQVEAALVREFVVERVTAKEGNVHVAIRALAKESERIVPMVTAIAQHVSGVKTVSVDFVEPAILVD